MERDGIEEVELFPSVPDHGEQVGVFENLEVLGHSLAGHVEVGAKLSQGPAVLLVKLVEELPAAGIGEGFENIVHFVPANICN